jgi:hypothetical protein
LFVDIIPASGPGRGRPLRLEAAQVLVYDALGTPVAVSAVYGSGVEVWSEHAGNPAQFNRALRALGVPLTTLVSTLKLPPPNQGARLVAGPS